MRTHDISLAAYLAIKGFSHTVEKKAGKGVFIFSGNEEFMHTAVRDFHNGDGSFLLFHQNVRALKAQVNHTPDIGEMVE